MCTTKLVRFGWVEGRVNASEHHVRATIASHFPNLVTTKCIRRVDADADNISSLNVEWVHGIQSFIDQGGITEARGCCRGQDQFPRAYHFFSSHRQTERDQILADIALRADDDEEGDAA